jgi:hypothetical protein
VAGSEFRWVEQTVALPHYAIVAYTAAARDRLFGDRWRSTDNWTATKARAQAEVRKHSNGNDDAGVTSA